MKSNELRIGNKVQADGDIYTVLEIYEDQLRVIMDVANAGYDEVCIMHIANAKPIPLTIEWLVKLGFVKSNMSDGEQYGRGDINMHLDSRWWFNILDGVNMGSVQHVHQLQNLHFALTNAELTITL